MFGRKEDKKTFFVVSIDYSKFYFTNQEDAMKLFTTVTALAPLDIENKMIDKFDGKDYSGYEYLHYVNGVVEAELKTEQLEILSEEEVINRAGKRQEEKEAFKAKNKKAKRKS